MRVDYIDHMGTDLTVVNAARVSFAAWAGKLEDRTRDWQLIRYLAREGHWSPFAHPMIQLRVTAPIPIARQLAKHQVGASWNEVSRRYVKTPPEYYLPWFRKAPDGNIKQGSGDEFDAEDQDDLLFELRGLYQHAAQLYGSLIQRGVCPEQARYALPQGMMTSWIWTGSLLFFMRVCQQRLDSHAQQEVREVAESIADIVKPLFPVSWDAWMSTHSEESEHVDALRRVRTRQTLRSTPIQENP